MDSYGLWALVGGCWLVTALAALATRALETFSHSKLQDVCKRRGRPERLGVIMDRDDAVGLATATLMALAAVAYAVGVLALSTESFTLFSWALVEGIVLATLGVLAALVWIPISMAPLWGEPFVYFAWPGLRAIEYVMWPVTSLSRLVRAVVFRLAGRPDEENGKPDIEEELRTVVDEGQREGVLEEEAREMLEGVIAFSDVQVSEVMTPRTDMVSLPINASLEAACAVVRDHGHSRIPLVGKNRDEIVGLLYVKDVLARMSSDEPGEIRLREVTREPFFVPESKLVIDLLREMKRTRVHMAVVLDEYGGTSGVVTIEDILEEIVGEIADEYDRDEEDGLTLLNDHLAEVDARVHVDELNEKLHLATALPEDGDYETIGGFAFSQLGRIPNVGDEFQWENVRFTVLEVGERRINRLRLEVVQPEESG